MTTFRETLNQVVVLLPMKGEFFVLPKICFTVLPMVGLSFPNMLV